MIRGVFLDANGVLYSRAESDTRLAQRLLHERGLNAQLSRDAHERLEMLQGQATVGRINAATYWDEFLRAHGVGDDLDRTRLREAILSHSSLVEVAPEAGPTLAELKRRGFILGVITNTIYPPEWKLEWLSQAGVAGVLDVVACSTAVGAQKPDPAIFLQAVAQIGLSPPECAFVGHDRREIDAARRMGMVTVAVGEDAREGANYFVPSLAGLLVLSIFGQAHPD